MSTTIRIDAETKSKIDALSSQTGERVGRLVARAIDDLERSLFFEAMNSRYAKLRGDPSAWNEILTEREAESSSIADDLQG